MANKIETVGEPRKAKVYYTLYVDKGELRVYGFAIFDKVVYVRVRIGKKVSEDKDSFEWLLEPAVEAVGLSLQEVIKND